MKLVNFDRLEHIFFDEGPDGLRHAAYAFAFLGFVGGMAILLNLEGGFDPKYLWFAGIGLIPASLCWMLSIAIRRRHIAVVPLTVALCMLSLYLFSGDPNAAVEGLSPQIPLLIAAWIVFALEYVLIAAVLFFIFRLWRKSAFT